MPASTSTAWPRGLKVRHLVVGDDRASGHLSDHGVLHDAGRWVLADEHWKVLVVGPAREQERVAGPMLEGEDHRIGCCRSVGR
eukprot:3901386-Lingulodinium_polyedra.AAC.1